MAGQAPGKAATSAGCGRARSALQADSPVIQAIIAAMGGRMLPARGAVPVSKTGELVGAIGASGPPLNRTSSVPRLGPLSSRPSLGARGAELLSFGNHRTVSGYVGKRPHGHKKVYEPSGCAGWRNLAETSKAT